MKSPTPEQIKAAREAAKLSQVKAAECVYAGRRTWQQWEMAERNMHPAFFELFLIKTGQLDINVNIPNE